jgi:DNA repair protein RadA/Sms
MTRIKTRWVCQECGFQTPGFLGRCTECNSWNSLVEEQVIDELTPKNSFASRLAALSPLALDSEKMTLPVALDDVETSDTARLKSGIAGLDDVLGGGIVRGAVILLAGDPGIGKSTLLLQVAKRAAANHEILYITGEESAAQIRLRAQRLGISSEKKILVYAEQNVANIRNQMLATNCKIVIVDSIQSVYYPEITSAPGSVSQVRESTQLLLSAAKMQNIALILVGHVTKDGSIAGPRVLEHMVDVVLQCEGDKTRQLRILRATKNRFGSTQEIAVFEMAACGLTEIDNPSAFLLADRLAKLGLKQAPSGTCVIASMEGSKSLLLEAQALVCTSSLPSPRRVVNGWDYNRLLQLVAVLDKKIGLTLSGCDVYVNIVGGLEFADPSGDVGIACAIATSLLDRSLDPGLVLIGEVGLTGEVRPVVSLERRLKEAQKLGFHRAVVPKGNLPLETSLSGMEVVGVEYLKEALSVIMPGVNFTNHLKARQG